MKSAKVTIQPKTISGIVTVPPSKSISHRAVICAGLSARQSTIKNLIYSDDIKASLQAMSQFGMTIESETQKNDRYTLALVNHKMAALSQKPVQSPITIDCHESGSTIRFLMPFFHLSSEAVTFIGRGRLAERPYTTFYRLFDERGIVYETTNGILPTTIKGALKAGRYAVEGNVSSQFITGLMFMLPLLDGDSVIEITTQLESKGYIDLTLEALRAFGIIIENKDYEAFVIPGGQSYKGCEFTVDGDYSQAAFWLVAAAIGNEVELDGMKWESLQGDRAIIDIIEAMGGKVTFENQRLTVTVNKLNGVVIDASQCPDLVPVVAVLCSMCKGESRIINAERLRIKESDRLKAISTELNKMGAKIEETPDGLIIQGIDSFKGAAVESWNDHRIAMALAIASTRSTGDVIIDGASAVNKSYPMFWEDFKKVGGVVYE
ncbi:3-phosphoshikimate 1-carboxyvinyltransferase [Fusibacter paucivorans]|uniref:3-phosphoshikimate 1-carboxyvinyltransferase n=1 Tax=Fusibacter paucivorans TaxID=76009 RepID=A0ABS5PSS0_9FIRM|nr:3-phosphoshikimate 1-carboxyvinyltransferase [Fusibacter paucivorans]MBS7528138.1 3-phosphoshikimate 1-carboxyvinyltransferase [Fusibacter paucivorans]